MKPVTIAVAGKGGTGKTTICGIIIEYLNQAGKKPILAVDADPNSNLNEVLGIDAGMSIGEIRERLLNREAEDPTSLPAGMTKQEYADFLFSDALTEGKDYDLLVMGRTQGKGCYCYVNDVLKKQIDRYSERYRFIVVDNEAGMEHVSRGILPNVDVLLLISDSSRRGIQAAGRIARMIGELNLKAGLVKLVINRARNGVIDEGLKAEVQAQGLDMIGVLPDDETVYRYDSEGEPCSKVPEESAIKLAMKDIIGRLGI